MCRNANAPGARLFYDGFITGAHFKKTDTTIQVTGTLNADAAQIIKDGGGFYDFDGRIPRISSKKHTSHESMLQKTSILLPVVFGKSDPDNHLLSSC